MNSKIYLCGHTGSINRGCEAIVRSTIKVIKHFNSDPILYTYNKSDDLLLGLDKICSIIPYDDMSSHYVRRAISKIRRTVNRNDLYLQYCMQRGLFEVVNNNDLLLQVGGDTYCYGRALPQYASNNLAQKVGIPNVLWSCSIENIDREMARDLNKYTHIFTRETTSYRNLQRAGIAEDKLTLMADSAFILDESESEFAEKLNLENTVGINVSQLSIKLEKERGRALGNIRRLINYILKETDMSVTLIPHVYDRNFEDIIPLRELFDDYADSKKIQLVDECLTCEQLKFIVARCRFFVGARTHATIAAYSSCVPTLTLGYSIKSVGIANDLFGGTENYVVKTQDLESEQVLTDCFIWIQGNEDKIRKQLAIQIPQMKKSVYDAGRKMTRLSEEKR